MNARIDLNLLPEQKRYLEHLIKEYVIASVIWHQNKSDTWASKMHDAEDLIKTEFGLSNL